MRQERPRDQHETKGEGAGPTGQRPGGQVRGWGHQEVHAAPAGQPLGPLRSTQDLGPRGRAHSVVQLRPALLNLLPILALGWE